MHWPMGRSAGGGKFLSTCIPGTFGSGYQAGMRLDASQLRNLSGTGIRAVPDSGYIDFVGMKAIAGNHEPGTLCHKSNFFLETREETAYCISMAMDPGENRQAINNHVDNEIMTNEWHLKKKLMCSILRVGPAGFRALWIMGVCVLLCGGAVSGEELEMQFGGEIQKIVNKNCSECHGPRKSKGGLNFDDYPDYMSVVNDVDLWKMVLERVQASEMPPSGSPEMDYNQRQTLMNWLRKLPTPELDCDQLASDRTENYYQGYVMSRRLTRHEYENSINDLFGTDTRLAGLLPADGSGGEGFDTNGSTLFSSPLLVEKYLLGAELAVKALMRSPLAEQDFTQIAPISQGQTEKDRAYFILDYFARRAFRRPLSPDEVARYLSLYEVMRDSGEEFRISVGYALEGVLMSPNFLFLMEKESEEPGTHPLGSHELAARLAYFLWSSLPDDRLMELADSGEILKTEVIEAEVHRMLKDPRVHGLARRFGIQWLDLDDLAKSVQPDSRIYPEFDENLLDSMKGELDYFLVHLLRNDQSLLTIIESDYTFIDRSLAQLYGLDWPEDAEVDGRGFRRVLLNSESPRGGVLGMSAIHLATSYPTRTSPVLRGRWILESLIGDEVPPPPPNVPALVEPGEQVKSASLRQQLEEHRKNPDCAACHNRMDPLGFGLENFDALGRWRTQENGLAIDASGTLPSGESFSGPAQLRKIVLSKKDKVMKHLVRKMVGYAYGRQLNKFDRCVIEEGYRALQANEFRPSSLVSTIATSFPFRHRFYAKQD